MSHITLDFFNGSLWASNIDGFFYARDGEFPSRDDIKDGISGDCGICDCGCLNDFRSCLDFWDIVVDGYLIATLLSYSGFNRRAEFRKDLTKNSDASIRLFDKINAFANDLATFGHVNTFRKPVL
jgi:hypothetical protein